MVPVTIIEEDDDDDDDDEEQQAKETRKQDRVASYLRGIGEFEGDKINKSKQLERRGKEGAIESASQVIIGSVNSSKTPPTNQALPYETFNEFCNRDLNETPASKITAKSSKPQNSPSRTLNKTANYLTSIVKNKSSSLIQNLKQQYSSYFENNSTILNMSSSSSSSNQQQSTPQPAKKRDISERQMSDASFFSEGSSQQYLADIASIEGSSKWVENPSSSLIAQIQNQQADKEPTTPPTKPARPPLPPPPPKELIATVAKTNANPATQANKPSQQQLRYAGNLTLTQSLDVTGGSSASNQQTSASSMIAMRPLGGTNQLPVSTRRHAIQEQSLERDAALSLKVQQQKEHKHKRTASIKSALRHAHLGHLGRGHHDKQHKTSGEHKENNGPSSSSNKDSTELAKSMPYELFEPPVTQRTFERSKRRDAMLSDPKRQLSADTIGLRQLTDEYLHNAGVKPISSSGQCSLVALGASSASNSNTPAYVGPLQSQDPINSVIPAVAAGQQPASTIESELYQVSKRMLGSRRGVGAHTDSNGSEDSLSMVTVSPGSLPWQSDVCIQCELLQAPPAVEPYETTGDILNTIALPFRGSTMQLADLNNDSSNQLSATLKRGLSAVINAPHHHLNLAAPTAAALQVVGGNLKKSLSNTLDISLASANPHSSTSRTLHLHSQDSLPAYTQLHNELEPSEQNNSFGFNSSSYNQQQQQQQQQSTATQMNSNEPDTPGSGGLMSQLAIKLSRQSSKKFTASKKGLHRALSFDCRGYKRLDGVNQQQNQAGQHQNNQNNLLTIDQQQGSSGHRHLSASSKLRSHNRSTLGLNSDQSPRPYLAQSASQVDFQLPLLPYHKMQEAIVSQRLLKPPPKTRADQSSGSSSGNGSSLAQNCDILKVDADQLLCSQTSNDFTPPVEPSRPNKDFQQDLQWRRKESASSVQRVAGGSSNPEVRRSTAPRLILDIPKWAQSKRIRSDRDF